jgi:hypothetical protein
MNRKMLAAATGLFVVAAGMLIWTAPASADAPFPADCHLDGINQGLDSAIAQIKSSPALGHADGEYGKALASIQEVKNHLHNGCRDWNEHRH